MPVTVLSVHTVSAFIHTCKHQGDNTYDHSSCTVNSFGYLQSTRANEETPKLSCCSLLDEHPNQVQLECQRPKTKHLFCISFGLLVAGSTLITFRRGSDNVMPNVMPLSEISLK